MIEGFDLMCNDLLFVHLLEIDVENFHIVQSFGGHSERSMQLGYK